MTAVGAAPGLILHFRPSRWTIGIPCALVIVVGLGTIVWGAIATQAVDVWMLLFACVALAAALVFVNVAYFTSVAVTEDMIAHRWFFGLRYRSLPWAQVDRVRYEPIRRRADADAARLVFAAPGGSVAIGANWYDASDIEQLVEYCRYRGIEVAPKILRYIDWETRTEDDPRPPFGSEPPRWPPV
jgi:hypothetical protein